ncbi:MAG: hypothetical protein FJ290_10245 [Planctomycetes bacterium]|nr:hypothetical protein [Planctomycetota bacterium]
MASIFKRGRGWVVTFYDGHGVRQWVRAPDKSTAERIKLHAESDAAMRRAGMGDPREAQAAEAERRPLRDHLADYQRAIEAAGRTPKHSAMTAARVGRLLDATRAVRISDLLPATFQAAVGKLLSGGLSKQSGTHYVRAVKAFSTWLWREGRCRDDRLGPLRGYNAAEDRRRERAPLGDGEIRRVVRAALEGPAVEGVPGDVRGMAYVVASLSGLRAGELRSLTPESFKLGAEPPAVVVAARSSKRRRLDRQPLPPGVVPLLRAWLSGRAAGEPVFPLPRHTARMLRHDLAAARGAWLAEASTAEERERREESDFLSYRDGEGHYRDFHSLRHTFITGIVRVATPRVAQDLARHSTPALTIGAYSHSDDAERSRAVALLPWGRSASAAGQSQVVASRGNGTPLDSHGQLVLSSAWNGEDRQFDSIRRVGRVDEGDGFENR